MKPAYSDSDSRKGDDPQSKFSAPMSTWLSLTALLLLTGCGVEEQRVVELEKQLSGMAADAQKDTDDLKLTIESLQTERDQLLSRLEQAEMQGRTALEQSTNIINEQAVRFERYEKALGALANRRESLESVAYLPVGFQNHSTLGTAHGTFLTRLDTVERASDGTGGYVARLNIGNPLGLTVHEFSLRGHFGGLRPEPLPTEADEDFQLRIEAWEKSLIPFQHLFLEDLKPGEWTKIELPINSPQLSDIRMLRFAMIIERAFLENQSGSGEMAVLSGITDGTAMAKTDYGAFLINASGTTPTDGGLRLNLSIGNPFILTLKQVRLIGEHGPPPPKRQDGENLPTYAARLEDWQTSLRPFEAVIKEQILPGRWTDASIIMPTSVINDLGYIRFTFTPESAFLPVPEGTRGPR